LAIYSTSSANGIILTNFASQNPVIITSTGTLAPPDTNAVGIHGTGTYAWTIDNFGLISAQGTYGLGVFLTDGGSITNQASAVISGNLTSGVGVVLYGGGGTVTNQTSGTISGEDGVFANNGTAVVTNAGGIYGGYDAVFLREGGTVLNQPGGTLSGVTYGLRVNGTIASVVTNQGLIYGQARAGVGIYSAGTVSNAATGVISGGRYGIKTYDYAATITNLGTIIGQTIAGLAIFAGGSLSNAASGTIIGGDDGVGALNTTATVTNQGVIIGLASHGVVLFDGGYVSNASPGTISGAYFGVEIEGVSASVTNSGSIYSTAAYTGQNAFDAAGVDLADGGTVINGPTGHISATWKGVEIGARTADVGGTLLNQGVVYASNSVGSTGAAVWIHGPGLISNAATGTIAGGPFGIVEYFQTTVVNLGTISGREFAVSATPGFADRVVDAPGAIFSGLVLGGNDVGASVASTLELASGELASGASVGTLHGLGSYFIQFEDVTIDAGATWTWVADAIVGGYTLTDAGTLTNTGSLGSPVTLGVGAALTNASGGTITNPGTASVYGSNGGAETVWNAGLIGSATYGVYLPGGGSVTNGKGGIIEGTASGVKISGGSGTVVNAGTIAGGVQFAGGGNDLLVLDPGGVIASATASTSAGNTLELASGSSAGMVTGLGSQFVNFGSLQFDNGADWFVAGNTVGLAGPISGFARGDTIQLDGITVTGSSYSGGVLTLTDTTGNDTTGVATLALTGGFATGDFVVTNVTGGAQVSLACFRAGTGILTDHGEVAVETLRVGDLVRTVLDGAVAPIIWVGRREVDCTRHPRPNRVWPVRVAAGAFGPGLPHRALFLSPDHAVLVRGVLIPIRHLINGSTIAQRPTARVVYYHIKLRQHDVVVAEGLPTESYLDTGDRGEFAGGEAAMRLFPDFSACMWEAYGCAPLIVTGPVLDAARKEVNSRAAAATVANVAAKHAA
jgi:Hint domain